MLKINLPTNLEIPVILIIIVLLFLTYLSGKNQIAKFIVYTVLVIALILVLVGFHGK